MDTLLTNYHKIINMNPLLTEILRERTKKVKVTWSHTSKFTSCYSKSTSNKKKKNKVKENRPNPTLLRCCTLLETRAKIWKEKPALWFVKSPKRSGNLTFAANNHIH